MADEWHPNKIAAGVVASLIAAAIVGGIGWAIATARDGDDLPEGVSGLVGGCERFDLYAQNRWDPRGAALRAEPYREADQVGNYDPNQLIPVNGWVRTQTAHPTNTAPWNSDVWFHVADDSGWVSFGGVRSAPSDYDPTGHDAYGGEPAPVADECGGSIR
jgi:hypothetical protein